MMQARFKMNFHNSGFNGQPLMPTLGMPQQQQRQQRSNNFPLNTPMINRIHNVKPGCSACGKKVA
jgi:hypothetical protein